MYFSEKNPEDIRVLIVNDLLPLPLIYLSSYYLTELCSFLKGRHNSFTR